MKLKKTHYVFITGIIVLICLLLSCYYEDINAKEEYTLTVLHYGNGTTDPDGDITVTHGEPETIQAVPDIDWVFVSWEILSGSSCEFADSHNPDTTVTLTGGDAIIQAHFADVQAPEGYAITMDQSYITLANETELSFSYTGAETGGTYHFSIDDVNQETPAVTGSGTVTTADAQVTAIDVSSLDDGVLLLAFYITDSEGNQGGVVFASLSKDTVMPSGSFVINNDNSNTLSRSVDLSLSITGASEMRFGNSPAALAAASWETCTESRDWTLSSGLAIKTVYGQFRDTAGNIYETIDAIRLINRKTASDGAANDRFGNSVAISSDGSTIVVGTSVYKGSGREAVYVYSGNNWNTETKITTNDGNIYDSFGSCVAVSSDGRIIVVGAFRDDGNDSVSGAVYVFDGTNWGAETKITASDGTVKDMFGGSVAISSDGSTIVVGASNDDDNGSISGSVYVYHGTNWGMETKKTASDGAEGDRFGSSVAVSADGSTIVAGASNDDDNGTSSGSIYIYDGTNWGAETKITASDGEAEDRFGNCVAVSADGNTVIAGAFQYNKTNVTKAGSVYIYHGTNWGTETKITASDSAVGDAFGKSLAVSSDGSTLIVGAFYDDDNGDSSGSVYVFEGTNWGTQTKMTPCDGAEGDFFGIGVAVSSDVSIAVAGASGDNNKGPDSGSAYIFRVE